MNYSFAIFYDILSSNGDRYYIYFPFSCDFFIEIVKEKDAFLKLEFL